MLERAVEALFLREVKAASGVTMKIAPSIAGAPDRVVALPGLRLFLVELKTDAGRLRPAQVSFHAKIKRLTGIEVVVLHGADEVRSWVRGTAGHSV